MSKFIIRPRMVEMYEIVKVRVILLYKRYEITLNINGNHQSLVTELKDAKVGDYLCTDTKNVINNYIKKEDLKLFQEIE